jgi:hypothetical protein
VSKPTRVVLVDSKIGLWRTTCAARTQCAAYECTACGRTWRAYPGPVECTRCGSDVVRWSNFDAWQAADAVGACPGRQV